MRTATIVLLCILAWASGIFSWPYLADWLSNENFLHNIGVLVAVLVVFCGIGLCALYHDQIYWAFKEKEFFEDVADKVDYNHNLKMEKMRDNAKQCLTKEELSWLDSIPNKSIVKIDTKV